MNLNELLEAPPRLHRDGQGNAVSYHVAAEVLNYLYGALNAGSRTLETGAGLSTVVFAIKGAEHTCVVPDTGLVERIKEYCARQAIPSASLDFRIGRSEHILPALQPSALDLVLVDGNHSFPAPFIDWYYTAGRLKIGGILVIDDTDLWTGQVLRDFLKEEKEWKFEKELARRTAVFSKTAEGSLDKWFAQQPYVVKNSAVSKGKLSKAADLVLKGDFGALLRKLSGR